MHATSAKLRFWIIGTRSAVVVLRKVCPQTGKPRSGNTDELRVGTRKSHLSNMRSPAVENVVTATRRMLTSAPQPPQYLCDLHEWPDFEVDDFDKPWKEFQSFVEAHGYALYGSEEYNKRSISGCCPTKAARDPFHPADDEDFIHRTKWTQEFLLRGGYCQMVRVYYSPYGMWVRNYYLLLTSHRNPRCISPPIAFIATYSSK